MFLKKEDTRVLLKIYDHSSFIYCYKSYNRKKSWLDDHRPKDKRTHHYLLVVIIRAYFKFLSVRSFVLFNSFLTDTQPHNVFRSTKNSLDVCA
jgi:hypothetical protein